MNKIVYPPSAVLELTYRCNHQCLFCSCPWDAPNSSYSKGTELSISQWKDVVTKLYSMGVQSFSMSGGEVLLKQGFDDLIKHIHREGLKRGINNPIFLISNGLAMKEDYLLLFKKNNVHLSMSLPGLSTFKEHTKIDNAEGVLHWFEKAHELGLETTVNITVTKKNYKELYETVSSGLLSGATSVLINRFLPGGRGLFYMHELMLSTDEINGMLDTVEEILSLSNRYGNLGTEVTYCAIKHPNKYKHLSIGYQCAAAKGFFVIDPSGQIRTCNHSPHIVGHILQDEIISDIHYWNIFANRNYQPTICKHCRHNVICDCGCREVSHILNGLPNEVDDSIISSRHGMK